MKPQTNLHIARALAVCSLLTISSTHAATYYWDNNGTETTGFGTAGGTWADTGSTLWSGSSTGGADATLGTNVITTTADRVDFGNSTNGLAAGTITVSGTVNVATLSRVTASGNITLSGGTIQTQYQAWALGGAFDADANGDSLSNGLAFLLRATGPSVNALHLLPTAAENDGDLTLTFSMLPVSSRGSASLAIEHSNSLANGSWTPVNVPNSSGTVDEIVFTITLTNPLNVTDKIPASKAAGGKLFGRIKGTNP